VPPDSPTPSGPRKGFLGFFKPVIEFFTSVTGMITAALGIIATTLAVTLAQENGQTDSQGTGGRGINSVQPPRTSTEAQRETPDDGSSITARRRWVSEVDALCEDFDNRAGSWPEHRARTQRGPKKGPWANNAAAVLDEEANRLESIETPAEYRSDAAHVLRLWREGADLFRQAAQAANTGDASTYNRRRDDILAVFSESARTLAPYGPSACTGG
jgi:hypothetical protein